MTARNLTPDRYREVTVAEVDVPLTGEALSRWFLGREAYRRTRFIVVTRGREVALVRVGKTSTEPLFAPITSVELLAGPDQCRLVEAAEVDTAVPTQLVAAARASGGGARAVVVRGRYGHVSFVLAPDPLPVRVVETVPPEPPKLVHQVQRLLDVADDLPPVHIEPELVDLHDLAATRTANHYLLPCRSGHTAPPGARVDYLDERPPRADWVLVGCARSREIHRWCYGDDAPYVDSCPRNLIVGDGPVLTKCCMFEEEISVEGDVVTVPWGASLAEVRSGLAAVVSLLEPSWAPE